MPLIFCLLDARKMSTFHLAVTTLAIFLGIGVIFAGYILRTNNGKPRKAQTNQVVVWEADKKCEVK